MIDNPQAYPVHTGHITVDESEKGMTLRDYFAGQWLFNPAAVYHCEDRNKLAKECYEIADAMLTERSKQHEN